MCNCRRRRCKCFNNPCNHDKSEFETLCKNGPNTAPEFNCNCGCGFDEDEDDGFPENPMFGQSYVPIQVMNDTFMPCSGMHKGTIFPELVSEYFPGQSMAEIEYLKSTNPIGEGCNR